MDAPGVITMQDHLPVVDYTKGSQPRAAIDRCPTGAIVWIEEKGTPHKGAAAKPVLRQSDRPAEAT